MKVITLGRYGKYPTSYGATCSYLIESHKGAKIVLDMGSGSLINLSKVTPYYDIDGVVISHFHGDHCADAFVFRNVAFEYIKNGVWTSKLPFLMPNEPKEEYYALKNCLGFEVNTIYNGFKYRIKDFELEFFELKHPLPVFGVKVSDGIKTIAYTADTVMCDNLPKLLNGCDLAIVDACILSKNHNSDMPHISVLDMAYLTLDIPLTMLTHLEKGQEKEILAEALSVNPNSFLAEELKEINL